MEQPLHSSRPEKDLERIHENIPRTEKPRTVINSDTHVPKGNKENTPENEKLTSVNTRNPAENPFSVEAEIGKLKISIPLSELVKHTVYRQQIQKSLQLPEIRDDVNILDDTPKLLFGPEVDRKSSIQTCSAFLYQLAHTR